MSVVEPDNEGVVFSGECDCGRTVSRPFTDDSASNGQSERRVYCKRCGAIVVCVSDLAAEVDHV